MKKSLWILASTVLVALLAVGCAKEQDLSSLKEKVEDLSSRVAKLEEAVKKLNDETVPGLQTLITALQGKVYVNSVTTTADGYVISFSDGKQATLTNGKDAVAPVVGIAEVEGAYVWTINGEVAKDAEGVPYPVVGISPAFKIEDGLWYVSYDGSNWVAVPVSGEYVPAFALEETFDTVTIKLADGSTIVLAKENPFYLQFDLPEEGLEILMGDTAYIEYTIVGAQPGDNIEVGLLSVTPGFEARLIEEDYNEGVIAIENVSANGNETYKILVFASNGKGKTDIRGLVFSSTTLLAALDGSVVPVEGGTIGAFIASNVAYKIEIEEEAQEWVSVDPATKALFEDYVSFIVKPNEANAYRSALISIKDEATGEDIKSLLIVQAPVSTGTTDLESAYYTPQGTEVTVYGITVVAASGQTAIITDGTFKMNMEGIAVEPGKVYDITGIIGETGYGLNKLLAESVIANTAVAPAVVDPKEHYSWYSWGDYNYFTSNFGVVKAVDGAYVIEGIADFPRTFVPVEPAESLKLESLEGKYVTFTGWAINNIPQEDNSTVVNVLVESVTEFSMSEATDWELYYGGCNSPYAAEGYPEIVGVKTADPGRYTFNVFSADKLDADFSSKEALYAWAGDYQANYAQYTISQYMLIYGRSYDSVYANVTYTGNFESYFAELDYGRYYIIAVGLDEYANFTGKAYLKEFVKEDPHKKAAYADFLGEWTFTSESGISEIWNFVEKEAGVSYSVENISGIDPYGDQLAVAEYNAETGKVTFSNQVLSQWTNEGVTYQDYFVAVYTSMFGGFYDNSEFMETPLIATLGFYEDGTADLRPESDDYGPLEGFAYVYYNEDLEEYNYDAAVWFSGSTIQKGAVVEEDYNAAYADYLGQWQIGAKVYTVSEKENGKTYAITGIAGQEEGYNVVANFEKGRLVLPEQVVAGTATDGIVLQGIDSDYKFYPLSESSPAAIFKAEVANGQLNVKPGNNGKSLFVMFTFITLANGDYVTNSAVSTIPDVLTWVEPGTELDPLQLPYTDEDFIAELTMDQLTGTNWDGYALMQDYETQEWLTERQYFGPLTVKDTEDADGEDLLEISGLSYIFGELYEVNDAVVFDLYNGYIYSHTVEREITDGDLAGCVMKVDYLTTNGDSYDNVNYCLVGSWVSNGIVALAPYGSYIEKYGITFDGISFPIYNGDNKIGSLFSLRSILLVDSAVYPTPEAANIAIKKALQKNSVKAGQKAIKAAKAVKPAKVRKQMNIFKAKAGGQRAQSGNNAAVNGRVAPAQRAAAKVRNTR